MSDENEYWNQYIAGGVLILAIYPIAKDFLNNSPNTLGAFIGSGIMAVIFVYLGLRQFKKQLKSKWKTDHKIGILHIKNKVGVIITLTFGCFNPKIIS